MDVRIMNIDSELKHARGKFNGEKINGTDLHIFIGKELDEKGNSSYYVVNSDTGMKTFLLPGKTALEIMIKEFRGD